MTSISNIANQSALIRFLNPLLALLLALTLASAAVALYRDQQNREAVAAAQISRVAEQMASRLDRFFTPVADDILLIRQWAQNGSLPIHEPVMLAAKLSPLMQNHPQVYAFSLWRQGRPAFMLVREGGTLLLGVEEKRAGLSVGVKPSSLSDSPTPVIAFTG